MTKRPWYPEADAATRRHGTGPESIIEPKAKEFYSIGRQCLCCSKYKTLEGDVGSDYGVCLMTNSPHFGVVVFEHFSCPSHVYRKE